MTTEASTRASAGPATGRRTRLWFVALVLTPFAVAAVAAFLRPWSPASDEAVFLTRVLDVPGNVPLVGNYSRYGWNHPGPFLFWWFAAPLWASSGSTSVALLTAVVLKGAAAGVAVWLAGRRAGLVGAALAAGACSLLLVAHPDGAFAIWNPTIVLFAFVACLFGCWATADGDAWGVPVVVVAGSVCIQAHVGYAPVVLLPTAVAAAVVAVRWWRLDDRRAALRGRSVAPLVVALVLGVGLWAPAMWDQAFGSGNLGALVRYFLDAGGQKVGAGEALRLTARAYLPWGPWAGGADPTVAFGDAVGLSVVWLLVPVAGLAAAGWSARRRGDATLGRLTVVAAVAGLAGVVAVASIRDTPFPYLFTWTRGIAALMWFTVALAAWRWAADALPEWRAALRTGATAVAVLLVAVACVRAPTADRPRAMSSDAVRALTPAALAAAPEGSTVAMELTLSEAFSGVGDGLLYQLASHDRAIVVPGDPGRGSAWSDRGGDAADADVQLAVVVGAAIEQWDADPAWRAIGRYEPLTAEQMAELVRLRAGPSPDEATAERIRRLNVFGEPAVLYEAVAPGVTGG